jgi:site-specific recombinase XerD
MSDLFVVRRHKATCLERKRRQQHLGRCRCVLWIDGVADGQRIRESLKTRNLEKANRLLGERQKSPLKRPKAVAGAIEEFLASRKDVEHGTLRNDRRVLGNLLKLCRRLEVSSMSQVSIETIDSYHRSRDIAGTTWMKELAILRHFFSFCVNREWISRNPAKMVRSPRNLKSKPREPYTPADVLKIYQACNRLGRRSYERIRARAFVVVLRYTALRISDVVKLERSRIRDGQMLLHTTKNGKPIYLPVPPDMQAALDALPIPMGTVGESKHFFWSGQGKLRAAIRGAERTLLRVFQLSEVESAHSHRFRHTLATEILAAGGTFEDAAIVLGSSPAIIRKYYAQWSIQRQERTTSLLQTLFSGTTLTQTQEAAVNL